MILLIHVNEVDVFVYPDVNGKYLYYIWTMQLIWFIQLKVFVQFRFVVYESIWHFQKREFHFFVESRKWTDGQHLLVSIPRTDPRGLRLWKQHEKFKCYSCRLLRTAVQRWAKEEEKNFPEERSEETIEIRWQENVFFLIEKYLIPFEVGNNFKTNIVRIMHVSLKF